MPLGVTSIPNCLYEGTHPGSSPWDLTLAVPRIFGSSRLLRAPAPTLGKLAVKATILPPIGDYMQVKSVLLGTRVRNLNLP